MALNFISEHIGSLQYLLVATPTTIVSLSMYAPKVAAIRCHVCVLAATPSTIGDFCPASSQGCRQPSTVCKTAKPSFWRLAVCRNTSLFCYTCKSQHVFTTWRLSCYDHRLGPPFCTCQKLLAQINRAIVSKFHSMTCNRSRRYISTF